MDHVAIMRKEWGLIPKVLSGEKIAESRWYLNKTAPWGKIKTGDRIFFKNSGEPVTARAEVSRVEAYEDLTPERVRRLLKQYGKDDGLLKEELPNYYRLFSNKRYCLFIYLRKARRVSPFYIDKKGFGAMCAWITLPDISAIRSE